ncbi:MAG: hypothetical protein Q9163_003501 [Psora crenata]
MAELSLVDRVTRPKRETQAGPGLKSERQTQQDDADHATEDGIREENAADNKTWDFYRSINAQHRQAKEQNTMFTLHLSHLHTHNTLLHSTMRSALPHADLAILNGFSQCNNTAQRLLKRATNKDVHWAAQVQRMQDAYEERLSEEKRLSEGLLRQMQVEVERWMERCEELERRAVNIKR